jgi:hypothetical protein
MKNSVTMTQRSPISLPFLGNMLIPEQAEMIAIGKMDPCTKQLFNFTPEMIFGKSSATKPTSGKGEVFIFVILFVFVDLCPYS